MANYLQDVSVNKLNINDELNCYGLQYGYGMDRLINIILKDAQAKKMLIEAIVSSPEFKKAVFHTELANITEKKDEPKKD